MKIRIGDLLVLWLFVCAVSVAGDENLALHIEALRKVVVSCEPLCLDVQIVNRGTTDVAVVQRMDINSQAYRYCLSTNNVDYREIGPRVFLDWTPPAEMLKAGASARHLELLWYDSQTGDVVLRNSGTYYVKVKRDTLESNVEEITVREADADLSQSKSWKALQNERVLQHLQWPLPEAMIASIREEIDECANEGVAYSPYIACVLAERRLAVTTHPSESELRQTLTMLEKADVSDFPLRSKAILLKGNAYRMLSAGAQAHEEYRRLQREFPNSYSAWWHRRAEMMGGD